MRFNHVISLVSSTTIISLYLISMFHPLPVSLEGLVLPSFTRILFYLMLSLLVLREVLSLLRKERHYIVAALVLTSIAYSFTAAIDEVSQLIPGHSIILPPSFIYSRCNVAINCNDFASLSISIPLTISSILFIYGLHGVVIALITKSSK